MLSFSLACQGRPVLGLRTSFARGRHGRLTVTAATQSAVAAPVKDWGSVSVQGTSRQRNEDRLDWQEYEQGEGTPLVYAAVFDGHGGAATAEWLEDKFAGIVLEEWDGPSAPEMHITDAFVRADAKLLAPRGGFFGGLGERGVGGSKCGATAAVALIYEGKGGALQLVTANAGDARVLLARKGKALQLTEDHVPDSEKERQRIERTNPNPKMPLVRYVGGTWRVGGLLALSRAFGDAYLKGSLQFEGIQAGGDGYSSGFGVVAQPYTQVTPLTAEDSWIIIASDGLFENEVRGGGGGLSNQEVVELAIKAGASVPADEVAEKLAAAAQEAGSTDDVTVIALKLKA